MGEKFQTMHKYFVFFVALVACHGSLFAHGIRLIKPPNQHIVPAPSADQLKVIDAPILPKYEFADVDSGADYANAFRPTRPGNSPGVGHKKFEVLSSDVKVSVAQGFDHENDFRPTDPGHSPGVGHPRENKTGQLN